VVGSLVLVDKTSTGMHVSAWPSVAMSSWHAHVSPLHDLQRAPRFWPSHSLAVGLHPGVCGFLVQNSARLMRAEHAMQLAVIPMQQWAGPVHGARVVVSPGWHSIDVQSSLPALHEQRLQ